MTAGSLSVRIRDLDAGDHFDIETPGGRGLAASKPAGTGWMSTTATTARYLAVWSGSAEVSGPSGARSRAPGAVRRIGRGRRSGHRHDDGRQHRQSRSVGRRSRSARRAVERRAVCLARCRRLPGPRRLRPVGRRADLRHDLGAGGRGGLGAVSLRLLELDCALGLDVDRQRALGLRPLPLRALGAFTRHGWAWAPVPRTGPRPVYAPALVAWRGERYPKTNPDLVHRPEGRLGAARIQRSVRPAVSGQSQLRAGRQSFQHAPGARSRSSGISTSGSTAGRAARIGATPTTTWRERIPRRRARPLLRPNRSAGRAVLAEPERHSAAGEIRAARDVARRLLSTARWRIRWATPRRRPPIGRV